MSFHQPIDSNVTIFHSPIGLETSNGNWFHGCHPKKSPFEYRLRGRWFHVRQTKPLLEDCLRTLRILFSIFSHLWILFGHRHNFPWLFSSTAPAYVPILVSEQGWFLVSQRRAGFWPSTIDGCVTSIQASCGGLGRYRSWGYYFCIYLLDKSQHCVAWTILHVGLLHVSKTGRPFQISNYWPSYEQQSLQAGISKRTSSWLLQWPGRNPRTGTLAFNRMQLRFRHTDGSVQLITEQGRKRTWTWGHFKYHRIQNLVIHN